MSEQIIQTDNDEITIDKGRRRKDLALTVIVAIGTFAFGIYIANTAPDTSAEAVFLKGIEVSPSTSDNCRTITFPNGFSVNMISDNSNPTELLTKSSKSVVLNVCK